MVPGSCSRGPAFAQRQDPHQDRRRQQECHGPRNPPRLEGPDERADEEDPQRPHHRLYDVAEGKLLWAGVSETLNPDGVDEVIQGIVEAAGKELAEQGLIP